MAFFGLTALGPQNSFASNEIHYRNFQIFEDSDFENVWNKVNGVGVLHCLSSKVEEMMKILFRGPVPRNDKPHLDQAFEELQLYSDSKGCAKGTISFTNFMKAMCKLRDDAAEEEKSYEGKLKPTCEFNSTAELRERMTKCAKVKYTLQQKQISPLTSTQEYGWTKTELVPPEKGRGGSDITKFQAELIKNGIYY